MSSLSAAVISSENQQQQHGTDADAGGSTNPLPLPLPDSSNGALDSLRRQTSALASADDELSKNSSAINTIITHRVGTEGGATAAATTTTNAVDVGGEDSGLVVSTRPDRNGEGGGGEGPEGVTAAAITAAAATNAVERARITDMYCDTSFSIYLNVYDLLPPSRQSAKGISAEVLNVVGMGFHHSGVEILGQEYSFGSDESGRNDPSTEGVYAVYPRTACSNFKTQVDLGFAPKGFSIEKLEQILSRLRPRWRAASYQILNHNCNHFTLELVKAIDDLFVDLIVGGGGSAAASSSDANAPAVPDFIKLATKYPSWVNRAANSASVLVPSSLIRSITDAINPPTACAPDLVNFIDIPAFDGDYPPRISPQLLPSTNRWVPPPQAPTTPVTVVECHPTAPTVSIANGTQPQWDVSNTATLSQNVASAASSGLSYVGVFAKKIAHAVKATVKTAVVTHVDDNDRRDFVASFEGVRADDLLSSYVCTVIHVNRPQKAKIFIASDGIRVKGAHNLSMFIAFSDILRYDFGAVIRPQRSDGNALPYFVPISEDQKSKADCILLTLQIESRGAGLRMIPLIDFSFLLGGSHYTAAAGRLIAKSTDVLQNAMAYIDFAHRSATGADEEY